MLIGLFLPPTSAYFVGLSYNSRLWLLAVLVQVNVPHKSGNVFVYDSPRSVALDYDLPPAHYTDQRDQQSARSRSALSGQLDAQADYDVPSTADASFGRAGIPSSMFGTLYDSPPSLIHSGQTYDVPTCVGVDAEQVSLSNRSSVLSVISNDSRSSIASLRSGSSPSTSARSSAEVSFRDVYDIPRTAGEGGRPNTAVKTAGKMSGSKLLGDSCVADRDSYLEDYSVPRNSAAVASSSNSSVRETSAEGCSAVASKEMQDFYDVPRNQQTEESCDYDIPSQSHSSSQASLSTCSSASGSRQLNDSVGQPDVFHRQIVAKHDAILRSMERLTELAKKEIRGDVKHWCSLVTTTGLSLRTALKELLDLGKVAESHSDYIVATRLNQQCEPLSAIYAGISQCLEILLAMSSKASEARCFGNQDLMNLTELVDRLHPLVNEFCVFLHSNAADMCRLAVDHKPLTATNSSPVVGRRQAPAVKPKPNVCHRTASMDVQLRPLPLPPTSESTPNTTTQPTASKENAVWTYDDYDYIAISQEADNSSSQQTVMGSLQRSASTHPPPLTDPSKRCAVINGADDRPVVLSASDRGMITYYAAQLKAHTAAVESAVGEFCQLTASDTTTPEVFVEMSKQVVLAGHKLVFVGDAVARHVTNDDVCNYVASTANVLCDCLKSVVITTKEAVLAVPSSDTLYTQATDSAKSALAACKQLCNVIESYAGQ